MAAVKEDADGNEAQGQDEDKQLLHLSEGTEGSWACEQGKTVKRHRQVCYVCNRCSQR